MLGVTRPSLSTLALGAGALLLSSTGGAVAAATITGKDIKDGTLTSADVKDKSLAAKDLSQDAVKAVRGTQRPRAWAHVSKTGVVTQASPGFKVELHDTGTYCFDLPGVSRRAVAVVTPDYSDDATTLTGNGDQSFFEVGDPFVECQSAVPDIVVLSLTRVHSADSSALVLENSGFYIVVP